jgi:hypothetical protein
MKIKATGKTESERFKNVIGKLLSISHEEMQRRIAADPRGHSKPKRKKRNPVKASASRASDGASHRHKD